MTIIKTNINKLHFFANNNGSKFIKCKNCVVFSETPQNTSDTRFDHHAKFGCCFYTVCAHEGGPKTLGTLGPALLGWRRC